MARRASFNEKKTKIVKGPFNPLKILKLSDSFTVSDIEYCGIKYLCCTICCIVTTIAWFAVKLFLASEFELMDLWLGLQFVFDLILVANLVETEVRKFLKSVKIEFYLDLIFGPKCKWIMSKFTQRSWENLRNSMFEFVNSFIYVLELYHNYFNNETCNYMLHGIDFARECLHFGSGILVMYIVGLCTVLGEDCDFGILVSFSLTGYVFYLRLIYSVVYLFCLDCNYVEVINPKFNKTSVLHLAPAEIWREIFKFMDPVDLQQYRIYDKILGFEKYAPYIISRRSFKTGNKFGSFAKVTHIQDLPRRCPHKVPKMGYLFQQLPESLNHIVVPNMTTLKMCRSLLRALENRCTNLVTMTIPFSHYVVLLNVTELVYDPVLEIYSSEIIGPKKTFQILPIKKLILEGEMEGENELTDANPYCEDLTLGTKVSIQNLSLFSNLLTLNLKVKNIDDIFITIPATVENLVFEVKQWNGEHCTTLDFIGDHLRKLVVLSDEWSHFCFKGKFINQMNRLAEIKFKNVATEDFAHMVSDFTSDFEVQSLPKVQSLPPSVKSLTLVKCLLCDNFYARLPTSIEFLNIDSYSCSLGELHWIRRLSCLRHFTYNHILNVIYFMFSRAILPESLQVLNLPHSAIESLEYDFYELIHDTNIKNLILSNMSLTKKDIRNVLWTRFKAGLTKSLASKTAI
jgi:hypothetical protein